MPNMSEGRTAEAYHSNDERFSPTPVERGLGPSNIVTSKGIPSPPNPLLAAQKFSAFERALFWAIQANRIDVLAFLLRRRPSSTSSSSSSPTTYQELAGRILAGLNRERDAVSSTKDGNSLNPSWDLGKKNSEKTKSQSQD